ncbi:MAG: alginate export family protein [Planctomycetaceae bacterium]|nr:alginate export family protein [Planctomycetales bacterium]MCB9921014.1 alginate export family protein [Planctomycetaceae bacterium]
MRFPFLLSAVFFTFVVCETVTFGQDESPYASPALTASLDNDGIAATEASAIEANHGLAVCASCQSQTCESGCLQSLGGAMKTPSAKAARSAYKGLFYDNNFDYLCDPCYDDWHLGESLKRRGIGDWLTFDVGGEYRLRYQSEHNLRTKPLNGTSDDFLLHRTRLYLNAELGDRVRFFGEAIDATSNGHDFQPRGIEVNRIDALNLFTDVRLWSDSYGDVWARGGRQELLYGAERFISPLDWSNTRRTFDGAKGFWKGEKWNIDGWWTRPVPFAQHLPHDRNFDSSNDQQEFAGVYATYKTEPGKAADFYFLRLADYSGTRSSANLTAGDFDYNAFGTRLKGSWQELLWEFEGGYQFGQFGPDDIQAGNFTIGLGHDFEQVCWKPSLWLYYDWASGDADPTDGKVGTANQYFPLGHKYLGWMDIVGRQNIEDLNMLLTLQLADNWKFLAWYHAFWLQQSRDALYDAGGAPIYHDPTGSAGDDIGQELDLLLQWVVTPRFDVWFGYSHFFAGDYFDSAAIQAGPAGLATNGASGNDADFFYIQSTLRY